jgi:hypothetical protein
MADVQTQKYNGKAFDHKRPWSRRANVTLKANILASSHYILAIVRNYESPADRHLKNILNIIQNFKPLRNFI